MNKAQSRRPANDTRPSRRSLVELIAAASRAVDDGLSASIAASEHEPRSELPERAAPPKRDAKSEATTSSSLSGAPASSDSAAEMMVEIAKEYQNSLLDNLKLGLHAALDYAKDFAEKPPSREETSSGEEAAGSASDLRKAVGEAAAAFQAEALELMKANVATSLDYARELASAKTAADMVELSGTQARKQCELMLKQAGALKSLTQNLTKSGSE